MNKQNMAYPYKGILFSNKNKLETLKATCNFRNEPQDNSGELKKTVKRKDQEMLTDLQ